MFLTINSSHCSFAITVGFRALQPNGLLYYVANSINVDTPFWLALYLRDGSLEFSIETGTTPSKRTKQLRSKGVYNDGKWWDVSGDVGHIL